MRARQTGQTGRIRGAVISRYQPDVSDAAAPFSPARLTPPVVRQLQRAAGNTAVSALFVQRCGPTPCGCSAEQRDAQAEPEDPPVRLQRVHQDPGGRKVFDCADYAGDPKLEACLNDEDRLRPFERGPTVTKVQKGLQADGEDIGPTGADGIYGGATGRAVMAFKAKYRLGSEQFPDVGPGTMGKLDELCPTPSAPPVTPPVPVRLPDDLIVKIAKSNRDAALRVAGNKLRELVDVIDSGVVPTTGNATADAVTKWLLVPAGDAAFPDTVRKASALVDANSIVQTTITIDRTEKADFARVGAIGDPAKGIVIEDPFFGSNVRCMNEVMAHEFFHLSGLVHAYGTTDPAEAVNCPHHLAELVFELATGETEGCSRPPLDDLTPLP